MMSHVSWVTCGLLWILNFKFILTELKNKLECFSVNFVKCEIALNKKATVALVIKEEQFTIVSKCEEWCQSHYSNCVKGEDSWLDYTTNNKMINGSNEDNEKMTKRKMKTWRKQPEGDLSKDKGTN